jgi:death-on-curing protein
VEETGRPLKYPTLEQVIAVNRRHLDINPGWYVKPDNLSNQSSLKWVLEAIQYPLYGEDLYPTLVEKSSVLAWVIIQDHVFFDGCKRTGMSILDIFFRVNGYLLRATNDEMEAVAIQVADATSGFGYPEFVAWVRDRVELSRSL